MPRIFLLALISVFICQCSGDSALDKGKLQGHPEHISVLEGIPRNIQEIDNLTVFPGDSKPVFSIELIPKQTYGKTGEPYLTSILSTVVDDQGRVIILDTRADYSHAIYVYNDDGSYFTQLGGTGSGPGEYGIVMGMQVKASKLFVLDLTNQRLNEYLTKDYTLVRTILFEQWSGGDELGLGYVEARNDGNYLVIFIDRSPKIGKNEVKFLVMDYEGNRVDFEPLIFPDGFKIGVGQSLQPTMPLEYMGRTITALSKEDILHSIFNWDFLIKKYDARGIYQSALYYPIQGLPFDLNNHTPRSRFEPNVRDIRNAFSSMDEALPKTYPVVETLMVDDENRIWVAVPMDIRYEMFEWWILAPTGELLAKLQRPRDLRFVVNNGYLYGKEVDEKTGVEFVVKYRINLLKIDG